MKLLGVDEKGRPLVEVLPPEATPWPRRPEREPEPEPDEEEQRHWGKILFAAAVSLATGVMIASGLSSCVRPY